MTLGTCMRWIAVAAMLGVMAAGTVDVAAAAPLSKRASASTDVSAQQRRPPTRFRVYPGLLYRDCTFRLAQQWRPSGPVIVPVQRCWWVRG
jgi:hypothetical protein